MIPGYLTLLTPHLVSGLTKCVRNGAKVTSTLGVFHSFSQGNLLEIVKKQVSKTMGKECRNNTVQRDVKPGGLAC